MLCHLNGPLGLQIRLDLPSVKLQFPLHKPPVHPAMHPVQEAIGSFTSYSKVKLERSDVLKLRSSPTVVAT